MHLNPTKNAKEAKTYAVISRYLCGIVQHTQTPFIIEYEENSVLPEREEKDGNGNTESEQDYGDNG